MELLVWMQQFLDHVQWAVEGRVDKDRDQWINCTFCLGCEIHTKFANCSSLSERYLSNSAWVTTPSALESIFLNSLTCFKDFYFPPKKRKEWERENDNNNNKKTFLYTKFIGYQRAYSNLLGNFILLPNGFKQISTCFWWKICNKALCSYWITQTRKQML